MKNSKFILTHNQTQSGRTSCRQQTFDQPMRPVFTCIKKGPVMTSYNTPNR
ncbi:hypothetical protein HanPSC8_Chr14g0603191 [Helianthus annuus]|nr:hypothetical protein HanPSC8_Chr14g0603191 [Helianthus annuus]